MNQPKQDAAKLAQLIDMWPQLVLCLFLFILITALLLCGKLDSRDFVIAFCAVLVLGLLLKVLDRLQELDIKNARLVLSEVRQAKAEIYAKADTVKKLAEDVAEIAVITTTDQIPQLMPTYLLQERYDREQQRLKTRDRVVELLRLVGADESKVKEAQTAYDRVTTARLQDLFHGWLHSYVNEHLMKREQEIGKEVSAQWQKIDRKDTAAVKQHEAETEKKYAEMRRLHDYSSRDKLEELIRSTRVDLQAIEKYLKVENLWDDKIQNHFATFRAFVQRHGITFLN